MTLNAITVEELRERIIRQEQVFLLDVRNEDAFAESHIQEKSVTIMNRPYFDLLDGIDSILDELPVDQEVIVICVQEPTSILVGDMLAESGREVSYVAGGMRAWNKIIKN